MIVSILGVLAIAALGYATWKQIPAEDPETIAARTEYGTVDQYATVDEPVTF